GCLRDLVEHRRHTTSGRVAHEMHVDPVVQERRRQPVQRHGVAAKVVGLEVDVATGEHDGGAVVAHRTTQHHDVAGHDPVDRDSLGQGDGAHPGGGDEELVRHSPWDDLGVTGDHVYS